MDAKKTVKKLLALIVVFVMVYALSMPAHAAPDRIALSFNPADAVFNDDGSMMYLSDYAGKRVYSVNTATFDQKFISFSLSPESMFYKDGKLYVSLCRQAHSSYWWEEDQSGAFAIIDCANFSIIAQYNINTDPYDIIVSKANNIYIASGSGQWTDIYGFKPDGTVLTKGFIRQASTLEYTPTLDRIYSITSDSSPRNMTAFTLDSAGLFLDSYGWPYHGDYPMGTTFHIAPDGKNILNSSGHVFTCNNAKEGDMSFRISLNRSWAALAFNKDGTRFYTALNNKQIYAYDYSTFEGIATYESLGYPQYLFVKGNVLISVSRESPEGGAYFVETVDLSAPKTTIEITITQKNLSFEKDRAPLSVKSNAKTVFNGNTMYVIDNIENACYVIDSAALTETKITFPNTPNSLYYDKGELFVGFGNNGFVAILDAVTFKVKDKLVLGTVFYDVAVGKDGFIYIIENFGSSATSYTRSYSRTTGQQISSMVVYPRNGKFVPHPTTNAFYWADTGVSPQDINTLKYENGVIKAAYDSPYHGDYPIGARICISPNGELIFTNSGSVFRSSVNQPQDMLYKDKFVSFADLVFDLTNNRIIASGLGANLNAYKYDTYEPEGFIKTVLPVKEMSLHNNSIIALSSENNLYFLELLDPSNILQVQPEEIFVNTADAVFLRSGNVVDLLPVLVFNDGSRKSIATTAVYKSSDEMVATVSSSGRLRAVALGYAEVTIESDGITKIIDVYVDSDITSISVEGYDINFSTSQINYYVQLPSGATEIPRVTYQAPGHVMVTVTEATNLPGTTTLVVTDAGGNFSKTYTINFYFAAVLTDEMPFIIDGYGEAKDGFIYLDLLVLDNPNYIGNTPSEYYLIIQLFSRDLEPVSVALIPNVSQMSYSFSDQFFAFIAIVDRVGNKNYIGVPLADPKMAGF